MKFFSRPIFTGFFPNLLASDIRLSFSFLFSSNTQLLQQGVYTEALLQKISDFFGKSAQVILFDSGRTSLQMALEALEIDSGDEILLQAYTCCVVTNAIIWAGGIPVYVDIQKNFTLDIEDLEKKITSRSKVIIVQHTFGIASDMDKIMGLAKKYNLRVIEDCAHVFGGTLHGKKLGTFGDISIFSFGSEKSLSCGRGGMALTFDAQLAKKLHQQQQILPHVLKKKIRQQLWTFIVFYVCKPVYNIGIGKFILALFKKMHWLSRIIESPEKKGEKDLNYPSQLPNALAAIALHQLESIDIFNTKRQEISKNYFQNIHNDTVTLLESTDDVLLRFPLLVKNADHFKEYMKKEGILVGDWYSTVIAPRDCDMSKMQYISGSCPRAEEYARQSVNLPTSIHITKSDQDKIIRLVNSYSS